MAVLVLWTLDHKMRLVRKVDDVAVLLNIKTNDKRGVAFHKVEGERNGLTVDVVDC